MSGAGQDKRIAHFERSPMSAAEYSYAPTHHEMAGFNLMGVVRDYQMSRRKRKGRAFASIPQTGLEHSRFVKPSPRP